MKLADIEVKLIDHMGSDLSVVNAARVSFDKESEWEFQEILDWYECGVPEGSQERKLKGGDAKLINYLAKHKHFSPFNHAFLTFRVKAPIFVARQLVKHKFMPWNEVSRRYVDSEPEFYYPSEWRAKAENVKQGSANIRAEKMYEVEGEGEWYEQPPVDEFVKFHIKDALNLYNELLDADVCAEQARLVLPLTTMTEWIWSGTLGAYADMLKLRLDPHTQYESRIVAEQIRTVMEPLFPVSLKALLEHK